MLQCFDLRLFFFIVFSIYFLRFVFFIKMHQKKNILPILITLVFLFKLTHFMDSFITNEVLRV